MAVGALVILVSETLFGEHHLTGYPAPRNFMTLPLLEPFERNFDVRPGKRRGRVKRVRGRRPDRDVGRQDLACDVVLMLLDDAVLCKPKQ
jgi:hypothetical protein